eukprot:TRINITY_DN10761_c0_g1_i3.p1 TRINITY_DN10761_c0_g1~~TRINITY_DN10761_c0_g1_i3.p1  ORF type:complete len:170 (+),score=55.15 TRINITY_DN10761_c0_g1_i3:51-512(+)
MLRSLVGSEMCIRDSPQALLVSHGGSSDEEMRVDVDDDDIDEGADDEAYDDDNYQSIDATSNGTMGLMMKGAEINPNDPPDNFSSSRSPSMSVTEDAAMETVPSTWRGGNSTFDTTPTTQSTGGAIPAAGGRHAPDSALIPVSATTRLSLIHI